MNFFSALDDSDDEQSKKVNHKAQGAAKGDRKNKDETKPGSAIRGSGKGGQKKDGEGGTVNRQRVQDKQSANKNQGPAKGGSGSNNRGNPKDEAAAATKLGRVQDDAPASADSEDASPEESTEPAEPEVPQFTFEEHQKRKEQARANSALFGEIKEKKVEKDAGLVSLNEDLTDLLKLGSGKKQREKNRKTKTVLEGVGFGLAPAAALPDERSDRPPREDRGDRGDRPPRKDFNKDGAGRGPRREGSGQGGDKGGRGPRREGGDRDRAPRAPRAPAAPKAEDQTAWPALGK